MPEKMFSSASSDAKKDSFKKRHLGLSGLTMMTALATMGCGEKMTPQQEADQEALAQKSIEEMNELNKLTLMTPENVMELESIIEDPLNEDKTRIFAIRNLGHIVEKYRWYKKAAMDGKNKDKQREYEEKCKPMDIKGTVDFLVNEVVSSYNEKEKFELYTKGPQILRSKFSVLYKEIKKI